MVQSKRLRLAGTLKFRAQYRIEGAEVRQCHAFTRNSGTYLPDLLSFELVTGSREGELLPQYRDLEVNAATLSGYKIKKDGTPGQVRNSERLYEYSIWPEWAQLLAADTSIEIQAAGKRDD